MKQLLILVTTLLSLSVLGQDANPKQKILIGFSISPDYSSRTLKNNDGSSSSGLVIKSRKDIEVAKIGYTAGLNVCFNFSQHTGFETGVQFSNKGYKTKNQDLFYFPPDPNLPTKAKTVYRYQYIGIPIKARFSFGKEKARFLSSIGFITDFLLNARQTMNIEYPNGNTEKMTQSTTSGFKKFDISPVISVGIDYKFNNKIHLIAEPTFRYGLLKTKDTPVTETLWNAGLNFAFYYALK